MVVHEVEVGFHYVAGVVRYGGGPLLWALFLCWLSFLAITLCITTSLSLIYDLKFFEF